MEMPREERYTYADYLTWDDGKRYELIDGEVYLMSPTPARVHQRISAAITSQLYSYLEGKTCEVYAAPFDVRLNADTADDTVVQPDIAVICDPDKLDDLGCKGAPDMIVEILSPSTARHDQVTKLEKYRQAGVREYWLVSPQARSVQVNVLKDGAYVNRGYFGDTDTVPVTVLTDFQINLAAVFPPAPPAEDTAKGPGPAAGL